VVVRVIWLAHLLLANNYMWPVVGVRSTECPLAVLVTRYIAV